MSMWSFDSIHADGQGFFEFGDNGKGTFQFCFVQGKIKYHLATSDGQPTLEWTWTGKDDSASAHGTGWAVLKGEELSGGIAIHLGDKSDFVAKKVENPWLA